jgi:CheY-like chemotaxis protein
MPEDHITVLLVEDDEEDQHLIIEDLKPLAGEYRLVCAGLLKEAVELVTSRSFDLIMLDLGLPDSQGLDTFIRLHEKAPEVPFVVITGRDDDDTAMQALKAGAQDYLVKGRIGRELLRRSIRYSIERQQLLLRIERERVIRDTEHEQNALERLGAPSTTSITCSLYGRMPVKEAVADIFDRMVDKYGRLLDRALEQRVLKTRNPSPCIELRRIAEAMGSMCAGPRDILDLHLHALKRRCEAQPPQKVKALTEEGRFLMIELMGYLASFYRDYYSGSARGSNKSDNETVTGEGTP